MPSDFELRIKVNTPAHAHMQNRRVHRARARRHTQ